MSNPFALGSSFMYTGRRIEAEYIVRSFNALMCDESDDFGKVAANDSTLTVWAQQFIQMQDSFRRDGKPILVEVAYHYTKKDCMQDIARYGLHASKCRRFYFGHGIYVANNPHAFRVYGDTGMIVLLMRGIQRWCLNNEEKSADTSADTFLGNKIYDAMDKSNFTRSTYFDEIVPRKSNQVLPLLKYDHALTNNNDLMWKIHNLLHTWVGVTFCQNAIAFTPPRWIPCMDDIRHEHRIVQKLNPKLPLALPQQTLPQAWKQSQSFPSQQKMARTRTLLGMEICLPITLKEEKISFFPSVSKPNENCPICLDSLSTNTVTIECKHCFHRDCLRKALSIKKECPICRHQVGQPRGACPFGTMTLYLHHDLYCDGFRTRNIPTIVITYLICGGIQSDEHENPGYWFTGTKRKAFLPSTADGQNLAKRLRYAFQRGLTFRVGTSLTSRRSDTVCWASIHHKTSTKRSTFGWPDSSYFERTNLELDRLKVPKAHEL